MTDPTTEALNAAKREFWERISFTDADTIDQMNFSRILDTIEAQARAAGREEERERIRAAFLRRLTVDSETHDRHKRDYNQAIFDADDGWAVFTATDLDMVMAAFDLAILDAPAEADHD